MNKKQVVWSEAHDWFIGSVLLVGETAKFRVVVSDYNAEGRKVLISFDNFIELKIWAGY